MRAFPWRSIGFWMALPMIGLMALNAGRAFLSPVDFAQYMGLPLSDPANVGFVHIYGLRAFFLGLFALILILRRDFGALHWYALAAIVMALGDAYLMWRAGGGASIIGRHLAIGLCLAAIAAALRRLTLPSASIQ
jgi:hypothetical protein